MSETLTLKFPNGLNNRDRESALADSSLREAVNIDVTRDGGFLTRKGLREVAIGGFHSFYGHPAGFYALCVKDGNLCKFDGTTLTVLRAVHLTLRMDYAMLNNEIFFSNGYDQGRVTAAGVLAVWGLPTPPSPQCEAVTDAGGFSAGTVRITQVAVVDGIESGAPDPVSVAVTEGGGVQVTVPTGATFRIYATEVDGDFFRQAATVASGETVLIGAGFVGKPLESLLATKPLPGKYITAYKGRLWLANGSVVWFTDSLSPHWMFRHSAFFAFDSDITLLIAAEDGLYVGTSTLVWFLQGASPDSMTQRPVLHLGAIAGSGLNDPPTDTLLGDNALPSRCCAFVDTDGVFCIGRPGGMIQRITVNRYAGGFAESASVAYWQHEGLRQFTIVLSELALNANVAVDSAIQSTSVSESLV